MKIFEVSLGECQEIANSIGIRFAGTDESNSRGPRTSGVLRPLYGQAREDLPYGRVSSSYFGNNRRVNAVCWHGHRDFMAEIFKRHPQAKIVTGFVRYESAQDFMDKHAETAWRNVGSIMYPMAMCQACECKEAGQGNPAVIPNTSYTVVMRHSDIRACPHVIFTPEHYRPDGSCKCDDPVEQERMIREDGYSREDFVTV
jgi:hypothetical protein